MSDYLDNLYSNLSPLTAAGIGIPNGPGANNYFWMVQPRALFGEGAGQWIEMGADVEALIELPDGSTLRVYGKAVGSDGTPDRVRVLVRGYADQGVPDAMYGIDAKNARKVKGLLPEGYAEGKGAKPETPAGRVISDGRKPQKLAEIETAPITPDDERMAEQGSNAPEAQLGKDYEASPEGQRVIANLPEDAADVATPKELDQIINPQQIGGSRSGDADILAGESPVVAMNKNGLYDELGRLLNKKRTPAEEGRLAKVVGELQRRDRESDILSDDNRAAYAYGFTSEPQVSSDGTQTSWAKEDPSGEFTRTITRETLPDGSERWSAQDYQYDSRDNAMVERGNGRGYYKNVMDAFENEGNTFDLDLADEYEGLQDGDVMDDAVAKAMRGEDPGSLDGLIMAASEEPKKKKKSTSKKKKDKEAPIDDGLDDFDPEADITDTPSFDEPNNSSYDVDFDPSELDGNRMTSDVVSADLIEEGNIILHYGEPAKVMRAAFERDEDGIETGKIEFVVRTADGNDYDVRKGEFDEVTRITLEKPDEIPDAITPEDVTPESKDTPDANRIAPDTAEEMSARNDLLVGDKVYSADGTEFLGTITNVQKVGGRKYTVIDRGDGSKPTQGPDSGTVLVDRPESAPEVETPETNVPDVVDEPTPAPKEVETPKPEEAPAPAPETPTPPTNAPDEVPPTPEEAPEAPKAPEAPEAPKAPEEAGKDRTDNGQMIAFPEKTDADLFGRKVSPLRDAEGRRVKAIDPDTGEEKSTFAEDPDAILNAILEEYPEAVIDDNGVVIVAREKFTDPDGAEYEMESRITRTNGANYMVSYKITMPDGEVVEYFHHDYRDSFSSIHGKANGIQRMAAVLRGDIPADYKPAQRKAASREWKYFATGKFEDRMKFFRGKYNSNVTREGLEASLAKAKKSGNLYDIGRAEYHLELLDNEFGGDIKKLRDYFNKQDMTFVTMQETIEKYAGGRFYKVNKSKAGNEKNYGTVLRSAVPGIFGSIKNRDSEATTAVLRELLGRLPDIQKHKTIIDEMMRQLEDGAKVRFPSDNRNSLRGFINVGVKALETEGWDLGTIDQAPHVGWDGRILQPGMLVQYDNNNNEFSVGILDSLVPVAKNPDRPNEYNDYVLVRFRDQNGEIGEPVEVSAKNINVLDETGTSPESLKRMTIYTPRIGGETMKNARFGDGFMMEERARESANSRIGQLQDIGYGVNVPTADPEFYSTDNATPGRYLYDANGLPLGQIAAVRDAKSDSGEDGYNIAYVTPENKLEFVAVKSGEIRAPKSGLTMQDGRGTNESSPGFTPDPSAFSDIGLDASTLGSDSVESEAALLDLVKSSPTVGDGGSARLVGRLLAVKQARKAYEADPSDANKQAYKEALSKYYEDVSLNSAYAAKIYNRDFAPISLASDDILTPQEVADINGKIRATQREAAKRMPDAPATAVLSYDELKEAASAPEHTYSGFLPAGWAPQDAGAALDFEKAKHAEVVKKIITTLGGEDSDNISDELVNAMAEAIIRDSRTKMSDGQYMPLVWDMLSNEFGDVIRVNRNGEPGSGNGYIASDADIQTAADVFQSLREKLNIGDMPMDLALTSERGAGGALGFVYTADMWTDTTYQARAHLLIDTLPRNIQNQKDKAASGEKFKPGVSWWAVDLTSDPEGLLAKYVIAHEMGHVMQGQALRQFGKVLSQTTWNKFYGPVAEAYKVSQYGESNYNEHFAESFVKWIMTGQAHPTFLKFLKDTGLLKSN